MKRKQMAASAMVTIALFVILILGFDMLYCLNDDLMIQSILSGGYSGKPSGMSVYLNAPLSFLLSGLYSVFPGIPWLGLFFASCYAFCFGLILYRSMAMTDSVKAKVMITIVEILAFGAIFLEGYLLPHYTVVAAVVGGSGVFLLMTAKVTIPVAEKTGEAEEVEKPENRRLWKNCLLPVFLLLLCYLIRSKVFYLMLPFLAVAGLSLLLEQKGKAYLALLKELFPAIGIFAVGTILLMAIQYGIYHGNDWQAYTEYNDARTLVYDFTGIYQTPEALSFYEDRGISENAVEMYLSYNILLEENNSTDSMKNIGAYYEIIAKPGVERLKEALITYKARALSLPEDTPYQYLALLMYAAVFIIILAKEKYSQLISLALCGLFRSVCWVYLIYQGRYPERVTMSVFIMEFLVLFGILLRLFVVGRLERNAKTIRERLCRRIVLFLMISLGFLGVISAKDALSGQEKQLAINETDDVIYSYMQQHPENFYLLDVYATVNRTEYAVKDYSGGYENYLLLGGWMTGSPLTKDKLEREGYRDALEALLVGENVYLVLKEGVSMTPEMLCSRYDLELESFVLQEQITTEDAIFEIYCVE